MLKQFYFFVSLSVINACAGPPEVYPELEEAKKSLKSTEQNHGLQENASISIYQANEYLTQAELALLENDLSTVDHYIYLTNQKLEIANELSLKNENEEELVKLKKQYGEMVAHSRRMDSKRAQDEKLQAENRIRQLEIVLGQYRAEETSRGTLLVINDLLFDTGGSRLKPESQRRLEPLVQYLQTNTHKEIIVEGHTDSIGDASHNKSLSLQRANAVKRYLTTRGIDAARIETRGFGEEVPVSSNTTKAGRKLNRRVEVVIKSPKHVEF